MSDYPSSNERLPLFETPHNGSDTSRAAAKSAASKALRQRERILQFIRDRGDHGDTREEFELATGISGNTTRPRGRALCKAGLIRETSCTRRTAAGSAARVLIAVGKAERDPLLTTGAAGC